MHSLSGIMDMTKYSLISNLHTGNVVFDMIFSSIILALIHNLVYSSSDFTNYLKKLLNIFIKQDNTIQLSFSCTESKGGYYGNSMAGSDTFKAVLYHIRYKISRNETDGLNNLKDYIDRYQFDDDRRKTDNSEILNHIIYMPDQLNKFKLLGKNELAIYFNIYEEKLDSGKNEYKKYSTQYTLTLVGDRNNVSEKQMQEYVDKLKNDYDNLVKDNFNNNLYVFQYEGNNNEEKDTFKIFPFYTTCRLDKLWFDGKNELMRKIDFFANNKEWYEEKGKPYTLSICTYGEPGCGKTSFEKALAKKLNRHIIMVDLSKIVSQNDADQLFFNEKINGKHIPYNKRIYVFPDFDCQSDITKQRQTEEKKVVDESVKKEGNDLLLELVADKFTKVTKPTNCLNLSKLLNIWDGIPERTGQIFVMDTNHPENLDKALLRPGRIDHMVEFKKMSTINVENMVSNYYNDSHSISNDLPDRKWTPAEVFKICSENDTIREACNVLKNSFINQ